jgi:hypothetical protein
VKIRDLLKASLAEISSLCHGKIESSIAVFEINSMK